MTKPIVKSGRTSGIKSMGKSIGKSGNKSGGESEIKSVDGSIGAIRKEIKSRDDTTI